MTEPEIEIFHQMLLRCDDIAGKLDYLMSMRAYGNTAPTLGTLFSFRFRK